MIQNVKKRRLKLFENERNNADKSMLKFGWANYDGEMRRKGLNSGLQVNKLHFKVDVLVLRLLCRGGGAAVEWRVFVL